MSLIRVTPALVMALALLGACGKRGPLYLPGEGGDKDKQEQPAPEQQDTTPPPATGY